MQGVRIGLYYMLLLCLAALTVVTLVRVVGIVMVIAMLTIPAAVASLFSRNLWQMMILSILLCALFTSTGIGLSYTYDLPSGPTIILITGAVYLTLAVAGGILRIVKQ